MEKNKIKGTEILRVKLNGWGWMVKYAEQNDQQSFSNKFGKMNSFRKNEKCYHLIGCFKRF